MDQVPRDVVADVLALLPPRALAVSRSVCREWRDVVDADARCHLRTDLLPLSVAGIFMKTKEYEPPEFFAGQPPEFFVRPSMDHKIAGDLQSYRKMDKDSGYSLTCISDCCNGLVLTEDQVVNPATRQWMHLPEEGESDYIYCYLVFDPTLSPHFEVFAMKNPLEYKDESSELPQLESMSVRVYSSSTQRWEERTFLRDEEHTTVANVWTKFVCGWWQAVYWHGALYVYWMLTFITRINVFTPPDIISTMNDQFRLGKSVGGVHFAVAGHQGLQVWFLDESSSKMEWVLKHVARHRFIHDQTDRPWIIQHDPYGYDDDQEKKQQRTNNNTKRF